jgi:hypothetical protein
MWVSYNLNSSPIKIYGLVVIKIINSDKAFIFTLHFGLYEPNLTRVSLDIVASHTSTEGVYISTISGITMSHPNSTLIVFKSFSIIINGTPN